MKLYWQDYVAAATMLIFLAVHGITVYIVSHTAGATTAEQITANVTALEGNGVAAWVMKLGRFGFIINSIITPAFVVALYVVYRNFIIPHYPNRQVAMEFFTYFTIFFFVAGLYNLTNDVAVLLGKLML